MSSTNIVSVLLYIGLALLAARLFGEFFERIKLSAILGELMAGILFGGPLFMLFGMDVEIVHKFMDVDIVHQFSQLGILFLLFIVGTEINMRELRKIGKRSLIISIIEVSIALIGGFFTAFFFLRHDIRFAIFFGTLFTATSIGVTVRTLSDLRKLGSPEGQTLLSVAVFDDFLALILVLILSSTLFAVGDGNIMLVVLKDLGILAIFVIFVLLILPKILDFLEFKFSVFSHSKTSNFTLGIIFSILVLLAYFAEELRFSGAVMAFLFGLAIQKNKLIIGEIEETIKKFGEAVFIPLFFFTVGANFNLDLSNLSSAENFVISWGIWMVIPMAILSKATGAFVGSSIMGFSPKSAGRIAVGITPRAEILLIIAGIGLDNGIFDKNIFTIVILLVFVTVLITPTALQLSFREKKTKDAEDTKDSNVDINNDGG
ncbi:MAG: cation:proton antiporter [Candidatus Heimdallarchaeaceae archaeon]